MKRIFLPINSERKNHEEILVIDVKGSDSSEYEHIGRQYRLLNKSKILIIIFRN